MIVRALIGHFVDVVVAVSTLWWGIYLVATGCLLPHWSLLKAITSSLFSLHVMGFYCPAASLLLGLGASPLVWEVCNCYLFSGQLVWLLGWPLFQWLLLLLNRLLFVWMPLHVLALCSWLLCCPPGSYFGVSSCCIYRPGCCCLGTFYMLICCLFGAAGLYIYKLFMLLHVSASLLAG